ncbi:MAG: hypothetical protein HQK49_08680 [Oligoflexia bacterium]|nr:hypothetical protein [Oligoflexia bacterium]
MSTTNTANSLSLGPTKKEVRKFGYLFSFIFFIIISMNYYSTNMISTFTYAFGGICILFFFMATVTPSQLKPVYKTWMLFGKALGWVNMNIILILIFYIIFTPIGLIFRIFRDDTLSLKYDRNAPSYLSKMSISRLYKKQF